MLLNAKTNLNIKITHLASAASQRAKLHGWHITTPSFLFSEFMGWQLLKDGL